METRCVLTPVPSVGPGHGSSVTAGLIQELVPHPNPHPLALTTAYSNPNPPTLTLTLALTPSDPTCMRHEPHHRHDHHHLDEDEGLLLDSPAASEPLSEASSFSSLQSSTETIWN